MADGQFLKKLFIPAFTQVRGLIKNHVSPGGIQYYGFKYHPRHPDFKDPAYEPSKLFLVTRIKHVWGSNPIERKVLQILNIDGHKKNGGHKAIVKNIPEVNKALWRVKHLVSIVPITCPQGLPEENVLGGSYLHDNGRFEVFKEVQALQQRAIETDEFQKSPNRLTTDLLKRHLRNKWMNPIQGTLNEC